MLWTRGVAARETLSYLDRRGIDAAPALFGAGLSRRQLSQDDIGVPVAFQYRFLELAATEANDPLLGLHVAAEMDTRAIGILFYLTGSSPTVAKALENLARYSAITNEALVVEISRHEDEVIIAIRHVQELDEAHRQFFELLALWFIRTVQGNESGFRPVAYNLHPRSKHRSEGGSPPIAVSSRLRADGRQLGPTAARHGSTDSLQRWLPA